MTVHWEQFLLVVAVALVSAVAVVTLFAGGIRLLATPRDETPQAGTARDEEFDDVPRGARPAGVTAAGVALFVVAGAVALVGVLLLVAR